MEQNKVEILEVLNNEKMYSLRGDEVGEMCSPEGDDTCGDGGVADEKTAVNQRFLPDFGHKRVPGRKIGQLSMRISAGIWWDRLERRNRI